MAATGFPEGPRAACATSDLPLGPASQASRATLMPTKGATGAVPSGSSYVPGVGPDQYRLDVRMRRSFRGRTSVMTRCDLRGNIPMMASCTTFMPSICSCRKPEPSTSWIVAIDFARLYVLHQAGAFFVTRAKSNIDAHRVFRRRRIARPHICDQTISLDGITPNFCGASASRTPSPARRWSSSPTTSRPAATICALYKSRWQVELFFKWIKQHLRIKQFYGTSENAVKTRSGLPSRSTSSSPSSRSATLCQGDEKMPISSTCGRRKQMQRFANNQPIEFIRFLTGH